jgi:hypothetical protein
MQRATARDSAVEEVGLSESYDALDDHSVVTPGTAAKEARLNEHSLSALMQVSRVHRSSILFQGAAGLRGVDTHMQMIGHGKRYVDFVDFSLLYMDLLKHG